MNDCSWRAAPILGVPNVRRAAEYYRDILGFDLDPVAGVFEPRDDGSGGVYGIVARAGAQIHFQIRRESMAPRTRPTYERDVYLYLEDLDGYHADVCRRGAGSSSRRWRRPTGSANS